MANTKFPTTGTNQKPTKRHSKSGNNYFWKPEDKHRGVAVYTSTGSFTKTAALTGIPEMTLRSWARQDWWSEESLRVKRADGEELQSAATRIAKRAFDVVEDRLENGDEVWIDGELVNRKISGKDAAIIAGVAVDKRKQLLETPNVIAVQSSQEKLTHLMEEFLKFAKAKEIKNEGPLQETQGIVDLVAEEVSGEDSGIKGPGNPDATSRDPNDTDPGSDPTSN